MKNGRITIWLVLVAAVILAVPAMADTFGSGDNQFTIDFVPISGDAGDLGNWSAGEHYTFSGVNSGDYRMGKFAITNDQWNKFVAEHGKPYGNPTYAYDHDAHWTGANVPVNNVSWYEAAQFVNWLNTSNGYQAAYKFTGTQGTSDYTFDVWDVAEAWGGTNLYRHKNAYYFLPTEDEWVKAAYWNGMSLQTWSTGNNAQPVANRDSRYGSGGGPWAVGSGTQELNGTYDMLGNVWEWMESPFYIGDYTSGFDRDYTGDFTFGSNKVYRGGHFSTAHTNLVSSHRSINNIHGFESHELGFRVASIPEPASLALLFVGGLALRRKQR